MSDLVIVSKLADLTGVPYYGDLKLGSATMSPLTESTSCVLTGFDETIQAHSYDPIRCYNAAVYKCISRQEFYIFCPLSEPKYLLVYKTGSIFSQSRYQNVQYGEIYLDTLNYGNISFDGASFPYFNFSLDYRNVGGDNKVTWIEDLPIFENLKDFVNYVTKPRPSVKVSYYLPDDTYTYSKLTYNSEHEPEDKDDGTSIDILPTNTSVNVNGLQENMLYYFTIFTNKSESEPFPFIVGEVPGPTPPPVEATYFINYYKYILPSNFPNWAWFDTNSYYFFSRACSTDTSWNSNDFIICNGGALYFTWDDNNNHWNIDYTGEIISSSESILYSAMYNEGWSGPYTITSSFSTYTIENWWNNFVYSNLNQITNNLVDILNFAARICRNVPVYVNGIQYSN